MPFCSQVSANTQITTVTVFDIMGGGGGGGGGQFLSEQSPGLALHNT